MTTEAEIESFNIIRGMLADTVPIEDTNIRTQRVILGYFIRIIVGSRYAELIWIQGKAIIDSR